MMTMKHTLVSILIACVSFTTVLASAIPAPSPIDDIVVYD